MKTTLFAAVLIPAAFSLFALAGCAMINGEMKYNAIMVDTGLAFKGDFFKENMTYGAIYQNENWDPEDGFSEMLIEDQTSPVFRTYIITEKDQLDEGFSVFRRAGLALLMMVVILAHSTATCRPSFTQRIQPTGRRGRIPRPHP
jgi:hypothetical protein